MACTYNARTLASEAAIEDLMMQARKNECDVIGLTETRRRHPLNAVYETREEVFLGICDSRGLLQATKKKESKLSMDLEKFYREDHAFYKVIISDFNTKVDPRRTKKRKGGRQV
ncbi:hypothetical protein RB195_019559 [Necator americanus]|uniref:Endonuclease/exonuclease/phosphatase domain-containing protein n=1 Tax=Necator americanus TaxID=51031 RepID=A0ABR1CER3_NECAM